MLVFIKKILLGFIALIVTSFSMPFVNSTTNRLDSSLTTFSLNADDSKPNPLTYEFMDNNLLEPFMSNTNETDQKDLAQEVIRGKEYSIGQGVYVYRDGNTGSPTVFPDHIVKFPNAPNGKYVGITVPSVSIDIFDYANSKNDFLRKYQYVTVNLLLAENFWNHTRGWTNDMGEFPYYSYETMTFTLNGGPGASHVLWNNNDSSHNSNERVRLTLVERWFDDILTLDWYISGMVQWTWGSPISHAAIIKILNSEYSFRWSPTEPVPIIPSSVAEENNVQYDGLYSGHTLNLDRFSINKENNFTAGVETKKILEEVNNEKKSDDYSVFLVLSGGFYFTSVWEDESLNATMSAAILLLMGYGAPLLRDLALDVSGKLTYHVTAQESYFSYTSDLGDTTYSNRVPMNRVLRSMRRNDLTWFGLSIFTSYYEKTE